jgi:hypothetical protein
MCHDKTKQQSTSAAASLDTRSFGTSHFHTWAAHPLCEVLSGLEVAVNPPSHLLDKLSCEQSLLPERKQAKRRLIRVQVGVGSCMNVATHTQTHFKTSAAYLRHILCACPVPARLCHEVSWDCLYSCRNNRILMHTPSLTRAIASTALHC